MSNVTSLKLSYIIQGDNWPNYVTISSTMDFCDVRDAIKEKRKETLQGVDSANLSLWKPTHDIVIMPSETLADRIANLQLDLPQFGSKIDPFDVVKNIFTRDALKSPFLDLIIQYPALGSPVQIGDRFEERADAKTSGLWPAITIDATTKGNFDGQSSLTPNGIFQLPVAPDLIEKFKTELRQRRISHRMSFFSRINCGSSMTDTFNTRPRTSGNAVVSPVKKNYIISQARF